MARRVARIEYLAQKKEIDSRLEKGESAKTIYEDMKEKGLITTSYRNFCRYVKAGFVVNKSEVREAQNPSVQPGQPSTAPAKFTHRKNVSAQEIAQELIHGKREQ